MNLAALITIDVPLDSAQIRYRGRFRRTARLLAELRALPGVRDVQHFNGTVTVMRGQMDGWLDVHPAAFDILLKYLDKKGNHRENLRSRALQRILRENVIPSIVMDDGDFFFNGLAHGKVLLSIRMGKVLGPHARSSFLRGISKLLTSIPGVRGVELMNKEV